MKRKLPLQETAAAQNASLILSEVAPTKYSKQMNLNFNCSGLEIHSVLQFTMFIDKMKLTKTE
ncbi:hypothetical protein T02_12014 [Trichinella nativa]|uniref:Uncharacterized protein n=1 Tax=Trichinella nativa TaxID=6335 RepID=A0A0V1LV70_9BILA|nr:hypothetical protein T02_1465 [Trichinella nativa]KRZ63486.1 hypothetical protein T02_12014 [Trichinella nativa]